ncbi:hypothetical protein D9758_004487 [Tetrapyrgos nigripes]|uniref:Uncharacterized protein n=1 Tax=Tetrapyrgos nigripes TaxID=182062 RepID=A0A8H5GNH8_9AGAR|nr:hypothetical protein D9758_004487 [Tetrapyrgos nigripes]
MTRPLTPGSASDHYAAAKPFLSLTIMSYPLPANEADFLALLGDMPYSKRKGYAIRLAREHSSNPTLLALIRELLSTSPLSSKVPYPSQTSPSDANQPESDGTIELRYPQTNASKRFVQRELGLVMAATVGQKALPFLLEALVHPCNAGRHQAITPCVEYASDDELVDVYRRCVPAVQEAIKQNLTERVEVKRRLGITITTTTAPTKAVEVEPAVVSLERQLRSCKLYQRSDIWGKSRILPTRPYKHLFDSALVPRNSEKNLIEHLFELAERYPIPIRQDTRTSSFVLPQYFVDHLRSFYKYDLARTISLVQKFCHAPDRKGEGKDVLDLPNKFNIGKQGRNLWGEISLEKQMNIAEPFVSYLMEVNDAALLKNGELHKKNLLECFRWPVITSLMAKALPYLSPEKTTEKQRGHVLNFILSGFSALQYRLSSVAGVDSDVKREHQQGMENDTLPLVVQTTNALLTSLRQTAGSDESMVKQLNQQFMQTLCLSYRYYPIPRRLYDEVIGIFSMTQVSKLVLFDIAKIFFSALKSPVRTIFNIPNDGVVQPYNNTPKTQNDDVLDVCISLYPPNETLGLHTYTRTLNLSPAQRNRVWEMVNDPEFVVKYMNDKKVDMLSILDDVVDLSPSPAARQPLIAALLKESESPAVTKALYTQCDISDAETRSSLQKLTYSRVFEDRLPFYTALIEATTKSESVKEWIKTLKWFIPRTKNEIPPDAERLPALFPSNLVYMFKDANEDEAKELAELYLGWEKQNNENVTPNRNLQRHLKAVSQSCLLLLCGNVSSPLFQFGLDHAWTREVNESGLASARSVYNYHIHIPGGNPSCSLEEEELARRNFLQSMDTKVGDPGHWRITDEAKLVEKLFEQYEKISDKQSFRHSPAYLPFLCEMIRILGTRWVKVPRLVDAAEHAMDILRRVKGTADKPAQWDGQGCTKEVRASVDFLIMLKILRKDFDENPASWWKEFRELRLLSTLARDEVNLRQNECWDSETYRHDPDKLDQLVVSLLQIHDTAIYLRFVRDHLLDVRQDLLEEHHIVKACSGVFNQVSYPTLPTPPTWDLTAAQARGLFPHQCEVFAKIFQDAIHSVDKPLQERVAAAEQLTKLPTTTIHELAALLKEDLNPRISEAILMFLPQLDEPAAGIQFLLAPIYLNGDLARTAVFGVNRVLEYVKASEAAAMIAAAFPPEESGRYLKVTVAKEFARIICQYTQLPEAQKVVRNLWDRKLHQDVRVALLQSIMALLGSSQEDLAWSIILEAVGNPKLQLDDTLFTLVAVKPRTVEQHNDVGYHVTLGSLPVLDNIAVALIPIAVATETESMSKYDRAKLNERVTHIRQGAYSKIFFEFLTKDNAVAFAKRALEDITHSPGQPVSDTRKITSACPFCATSKLIENQLDCYNIFTFLVNSIGRCVVRNPVAWESLVGVVDSLATLVSQMKDKPNRPGMLAYNWLNSMELGSKYLYETPNEVRTQLTQERMSLLQPLKTHDIWDQFPSVILNRQLMVFQNDATRSEDGALKSDAVILFTNMITMSRKFVLDKPNTIKGLGMVLGSCRKPVKSALRPEILDGGFGVSESTWQLDIKMYILGSCYEYNEEYAQLLSSFHSHVAVNELSFYQLNWKALGTLVKDLCLHTKSPNRFSSFHTTALNPILERDIAGSCDRLLLDYLFELMPSAFCAQLPEWVLQRTGDLLTPHPASPVSKPTASPSITQAVQFSKQLMLHAGAVNKNDSLTLAQCMVAESVYFGTVSNLDLKKSPEMDSSEAIITYPYFFSTDDSGGDIEDRSGKSTVAALEASYEARKANLITRIFKSQAAVETHASATTLDVMMRLYEFYPKLAIAHPSLYFSCLCLSFSSPDMLDASQKLIMSLKTVLVPNKEGESGNKWGWVPPPALALSFARKMLTEIPEEISDISLDENWTVGPIRAKTAAVDLLLWWKDTYKDGEGIFQKLLKIEGYDELMLEYEELKMLAWKDEDHAVQNAVTRLFMADFGITPISVRNYTLQTTSAL